ncbi:hypothetical protein [Psychromonas hadalis]|uniref:hypothetical protein n=1 Tax=Psychromonas hadalis TaxID=211669 RepID=UPI0003B6A040|nr:hypothetical protein [Psychromonas hadalis]
MMFKDKAIKLANEAKNRAGNLSIELQQSQLFDHVKTKLDEAKEKASAIEISDLKLMNLFAVFSLAALLLSTFLPLARFTGNSIPLSKVTPVWFYVLTVIALCRHLFGAKKSLSRSLVILLVVVISFSVFQQITDALQMLGKPGSQDLIRLATEVLGAGLYLFMVSFIVVIIATVKPGYDTNSELWRKLIQK